jgi:hypothetical protein
VRRFYYRSIIAFLLLTSGLVDGASASAKTDNNLSSAPSTQPATNDFAGQVMSDGKLGRIGIGTREPAATLDVYQGEVKLGSTGAPCTAALAGAIRYAETRLQLCDGAGWRNLSIDKAQ